jgi:hypothetical protein
MSAVVKSPYLTTQYLYGVSTTVSTAGVVSVFSGTAVLWVCPPGGVFAAHNVTCAAVTGAWSYANSNNVVGTWKAILRVPASTGYLATASEDYEWEVDASACP